MVIVPSSVVETKGLAACWDGGAGREEGSLTAGA